MEVENFGEQLNQRLLQKVQDSPTHRKASGILQSLIQAAVKIPNFSINIAGNQKTMAFYLTAGTYKLLRKTMEGDAKHQHQIDAYLLLLSMTLPETSPDALVQGGLLRELRKYTLLILKRNDLTPLVTRLAVSILSHSFAPEMTTTNFQVGQDKKILLDLFDRSVFSSRSNALSRECSRLLTHLMKNNPTVSAAIADEAKANLLSSLDDRKEIYLSNVKEVIIELPVRLVNDICFKIASNLSETDATDPSQEQFLAQTYYFLQKMISKLLASTLEDMILILINSTPAGTMPERVQLSYLQLLYESTMTLVNMSEECCNKILSPVISVLMEMLVVNLKIAKFANNQLNFIIENCIRPSLWTKKHDELSLQGISLEDQGREFYKIVCLFQGLLSSRFPDVKMSCNLITTFFGQLQTSALNESLSLVHKVVEDRAELEEKKFKKVMESIIVAFGVESILQLYPLSIDGDIAAESFEENNNLWMLGCLQKTEAEEKMSTFNKHLLPLLQQARIKSTTPGISVQRKEGYRLIQELIWRCLKPFTKILDPSVNYEQVYSLIEGQIDKVSEGTLNQLAAALQILSGLIIPNPNGSKGAELLIKSLAGILDIHNSCSKQVLKAIQGLSQQSSKEYVMRVFDKNIEKLIGLAEEKSLNKEEDKNVKNLEILMAVNSAINLCDPSVTTKYRISREELLLRLVTCLINSSGIFQKKGYKYLSETLAAAPKSLYLEIIELFEGTLKIENGSKHYRLNVISKLWSWLKSGGLQQNLQNLIVFIKNHLPQILFSLREHNRGARLESSKMIAEFAETMQEMGLIDQFIETVCSGLVGERSQMKLATISGLSIIVGKGYCTEQTFKEILEIVLILLQERKQELYKAVVEYTKKALLTLPVPKQKELLPMVLKKLFEEDEEGKMENRSIVRYFLIKFSKKHGKDNLEEMMPAAHRKMFTHALKMENREKKKKRERKIAYFEYLQKLKDEKEAEESSDEEDEREEVAKDGEMDIEEPLEELDNTNNLLLKYDLDKEQFHFQPEQRGKLMANKKDKKPEMEDITFDDNGIMIIEERRRPRIAQDGDEHGEATVKPTEQPLNFKKKTTSDVHLVKESGSVYRTNRAGGDLKLKDKPEPYAFIQFNSKALNKRFKKKAEKVFDNLFEKKEGGLRGIKSRIMGKH